MHFIKKISVHGSNVIILTKIEKELLFSNFFMKNKSLLIRNETFMIKEAS
jgi:hypothetical protein